MDFYFFILILELNEGSLEGSTKDCGGVTVRAESGDMSLQRGGGDTSQRGNVFQRQRCFKSL